MDHNNIVCDDVARPSSCVSSGDSSGVGGGQVSTIPAPEEQPNSGLPLGLTLVNDIRHFDQGLSVKENDNDILGNVSENGENTYIEQNIKTINIELEKERRRHQQSDDVESHDADGAAVGTCTLHEDSRTDNDLSTDVMKSNENQTIKGDDRAISTSECTKNKTAAGHVYDDSMVAGKQVNTLEKDDKNSLLLTDDVSRNKMPFGLCTNKNQESKDDDSSLSDNKSDSSSADEMEPFRGQQIIDLKGIDIPEMMSPKSRIDYINDMRKQLGSLITKGPSIVATNLLHGVSEPPIGSPKDKVVTDIDTWEVLTPSSSASSSRAELKNLTSEQTLHGTLTREGQMVSFVADDIMEKIRQSASPMASSRGSPASCVTASGPATPLMLSRAESFSKNAIPPIDPAVITDIEKHCKRVADSLDLMLGNLTGSIHNMSAITVGHIQTYKDAADKVGFTVDQSVKAMYSLMAKCEHLNKMMQPVEELALQIKGIKSLLDELEYKCK